MEVVPEFLTAHLQAQKEDHGLVILGNVRSSPEVTRTALVRYLDSRGVHKLKPGQSVPFRYFATGNVSLERGLLMEAGLFDERFREFGGEDLELGYRLSETGARFVYESRALSLRRDYRDIRELCEAMEIYGQRSLPILLERHPELERLLKIHLLKPVAISSEPLPLTARKLFLRLSLWRHWGRLVAALARLCNRLFLPSLLFDFLILFNYLNGFRRSERMTQRNPDGPGEQGGGPRSP
jgi:hypothetical protein